MRRRMEASRMVLVVSCFLTASVAPLHLFRSGNTLKIQVGPMRFSYLLLITVCNDIPGCIGYHEIDNVRCLCSLTDETLNTEASAAHSHHSCPGACFYG